MPKQECSCLIVQLKDDEQGSVSSSNNRKNITTPKPTANDEQRTEPTSTKQQKFFDLIVRESYEKAVTGTSTIND